MVFLVSAAAFLASLSGLFLFLPCRCSQMRPQRLVDQRAIIRHRRASMVNCLARQAARRGSDPGWAINYRLKPSLVRSAFESCRTDPIEGSQRLWAINGPNGSAVFSLRLGYFQADDRDSNARSRYAMTPQHPAETRGIIDDRQLSTFRSLSRMLDEMLASFA